MFFKPTLIIIIILVISFIALWIKQKRKKAAAIEDRKKQLNNFYLAVKDAIALIHENNSENIELVSAFDKVFSEKVSKVLESPYDPAAYDELGCGLLNIEALNILSVLADILEKNDTSKLVELIKEWESKEV